MGDRESTGELAPRRLVTIPNLLCLLRLLGAVALPFVAARELRLVVLGLFLAMALSDWLDGKLAVLLDQRSAIGPMLDSIADVAMYASITVAAFVLDGETVLAQWPWWGGAALTYLVAGLAAWWRHGSWPSYHTRVAKVSWLLVTMSVLIFVGGWSVWPLRVALALVALGNLESMAITLILPERHTDVLSLAAARRLRDATAQR